MVSQPILFLTAQPWKARKICKGKKTNNCKILSSSIAFSHGLINYKVTKTKCHLYWCLIKFIDWRKSQSCWYFRPSFVNYCPSNLLSGSASLLPSSQSQVHYIQTMCGRVGVGGWGGMLSCVGDHIQQMFNALYMTRFRTYKIVLRPQTKI